jgi:GH35 family endo-1,4-beta-xylanase
VLALTVGALAADQPSEADLNRSIEQCRMTTLIVEAAPGTEVEVEQVRHQFWFGAALANHMFGRRADAETAATYKRVFLQNFNAAVTENALKWPSMEPRQGQVDDSICDAMLAWTDEHRIPLRGHNIFWGIPNRVQPWLKEMDDATLRATVKARALDVGRRFRGRVAEYDLNNEMIHGNYYEDRLGPEITKQMADWVREGDPEAVLYLNDYDILTGNRLADYVKHIRDLLDQGTPIGGIGVQGHLHGDTFDAAALWNALNELAQFDLPIRITEFNMPGQRSRVYRERGARLTDEEELAKARDIVRYYRICFAHPAVDGILMWGFWEGANWIPASSLYRRDWTPTPAADAYQKLVYDEWWTRAKGRTDANGRYETRAFLGEQRVKVGGQEKTVKVTEMGDPVKVSFR